MCLRKASLYKYVVSVYHSDDVLLEDIPVTHACQCEGKRKGIQAECLQMRKPKAKISKATGAERRIRNTETDRGNAKSGVMKMRMRMRP